MVDPDPFYGLAERRVEWLALGLGLAGALFAAVKWGWRAGLGVVLGTALTWINFRWMKEGIDALVKLSTAQSGSENPSVPGIIYLKFFGRFALLLVVLYGILSRSLLPVVAVLGGLFAVVAAIMVELLFELASGKHRTETHT